MKTLFGVYRVAYHWIKAFWSKHAIFRNVVKFGTVYALFAVTAWIKVYDPDFGWHLQAGNFIWHHGIPTHDIFTYPAAAFRWIDHEWMSDLFVAHVFARFGYNGLALIYPLLWTSALFIVKAHKRYVILILAALSMLPYSGVRATSWTVFCLSLLIYVLHSKQKWLKYSLPLLFMFWANMHGGFFIGLAVVLFMYVKEKRWFWLFIFLASIVATCVNPYGPRLYDEVFRTLFDGRLHWQIAEWFPASFLLYHVPFAFCVVWGIGYYIKYRRPTMESVLNMSPLFFLASLSSNRHFPLFVLIATPEIGGYIDHIKSLIPHPLDRPRKAVLALFPFIITIVALQSIYQLGAAFAAGQVRGAPYPNTAISYLKEHPCPGRIFNNYNYGGYMIWQLPGVPVYIDGRGPSWRDENEVRYFDRYNKLGKDKDAVKSEEFKQYNIRCVLWSNDQKKPAVVESVEKAGWKKVDAASTGASSLWVAPN